MLALIIATKNDVSPEYSNSTLIGRCHHNMLEIVDKHVFSCPTFRAFKLGKANPRSLHARHFELRSLLWRNAWYVSEGTAELRRRRNYVPNYCR